VPETPAPNGESATAPDGRTAIAERLDRLPITALHVAVLALCTLGLAADIGEVALSNTFSALFLTAPYNASRSAVALLLAAVFVGGAVGAPAFGWWADCRGRRAALQTALAVLVISSLAAAASPNIVWMTAFRFISGLALGAYPPLTAAYLADLLPPRRRGVLMMFVAAVAFLGAPAMILLIRWLTPLAPLAVEGWRWALIGAAVLSAATAGLFFSFRNRRDGWRRWGGPPRPSAAAGVSRRRPRPRLRLSPDRRSRTRRLGPVRSRARAALAHSARSRGASGA
jgi:putative MFS transporter